MSFRAIYEACRIANTYFRREANAPTQESEPQFDIFLRGLLSREAVAPIAWSGNEPPALVLEILRDYFDRP